MIFFQGKSYDWSRLFLEDFLAYRDELRKEWTGYLESADTTVKPSLDPEGYSGLYGCELYGNVEVSKVGGGLLLDFLPTERMAGMLERFSGDTFLIRLDEFPALPQGTVKFFLDERGRASRMQVDIQSPDFDFTELELRKLGPVGTKTP